MLIDNLVIKWITLIILTLINYAYAYPYITLIPYAEHNIGCSSLFNLYRLTFLYHTITKRLSIT